MCLHNRIYCMSTYFPSPTFYEAATYLSGASSLSKVSASVKLELYGLYKYLMASPVPTTTRPFVFDIQGRAKWDAWDAVGKKYSNPDDVEHRYIEIAESLGWTEGVSTEPRQSQEEEIDLDALDDEPEGTGKGKEKSSGVPEVGLGHAVSKVQMLLDSMQDLSIHGLALENDVAGLSALLKKNPNVDLNVCDEFGYTPLHLAADRGNTDIVKLLLEHGADATLKDSDGFSALELANVAGHQDVKTMLSNALST